MEHERLRGTAVQTSHVTSIGDMQMADAIPTTSVVRGGRQCATLSITTTSPSQIVYVAVAPTFRSSPTNTVILDGGAMELVASVDGIMSGGSGRLLVFAQLAPTAGTREIHVLAPTSAGNGYVPIAFALAPGLRLRQVHVAHALATEYAPLAPAHGATLAVSCASLTTLPSVPATVSDGWDIVAQSDAAAMLVVAYHRGAASSVTFAVPDGTTLDGSVPAGTIIFAVEDAATVRMTTTACTTTTAPTQAAVVLSTSRHSEEATGGRTAECIDTDDSWQRRCNALLERFPFPSFGVGCVDGDADHSRDFCNALRAEDDSTGAAEVLFHGAAISPVTPASLAAALSNLVTALADDKGLRTCIATPRIIRFTRRDEGDDDASRADHAAFAAVAMVRVRGDIFSFVAHAYVVPAWRRRGIGSVVLDAVSAGYGNGAPLLLETPAAAAGASSSSSSWDAGALARAGFVPVPHSTFQPRAGTAVWVRHVPLPYRPPRERRVLLMVTGSVAAIKTLQLVAALRAVGCSVAVVASASALPFIAVADEIAPDTPPARDLCPVAPPCPPEASDGTTTSPAPAPTTHSCLKGLSDTLLFIDAHEFGTWRRRGDAVLHIVLRDWAGVVLFAPLTANTLAKIAGGFADTLPTCIARALPATARIVLAPAMNSGMWASPLTAAHLTILRGLFSSLRIVPPVSKTLACGETGVGALAALPDIVDAVVRA